MNYAYFSAEGRLLYIASRQSAGIDPGVIERPVSRATDANSIYLDPVSLEVRERQAFEVEISFNRVRGIPKGTTATLPEIQVVVDDGDLHFEADVAKVIAIHLEHPHYRAQSIEVQTGPEDA